MDFTVFTIGMLVLAIVLLAERSYQVGKLRKTVEMLSIELERYKHKNEDFAMMLSKSHNKPENTLMDSLTELLNRDAFEGQFEHLIRQSKRFNNLFAVLMIDILKFTRINETYSREIGDKLLTEIGIRLKKTLREVDIIARYENDVFIALLPNMIKPEVIVHAIERILQTVHMPFEVEKKSVEFDIAAGISVFPFDGGDKKTLIANAITALKKAKSIGKNTFQFYQTETQALGERELALKSAIKDSDFFQHIQLEYKPYYDTANDKVDCIEVVATLDHPEFGSISFSELSRVSQYSAKMFDLYMWMMHTAVEKISKLGCPLLFKFELKQFETPNFAEKIIEIVQNIKSEEAPIVLELVDDANNNNLEMYRESITKLNEHKIQLAIGVLILGHFALNKLNHIHFNYLKIDEKLVHDLTKRAESQVILERILSLVDNLKIATLTAGVDTPEQRALLEQMGCSIMQGKAVKQVHLQG